MIPKSFLSSEKFYEEYQNIVNFAPFKDDFIQNEINKIKTEFESTLKNFEANQKDKNENDNRRRNLSTKLRNMKQELFISELEVCSSEMLEMKLDELNFQVNLKQTKNIQDEKLILEKNLISLKKSYENLITINKTLTSDKNLLIKSKEENEKLNLSLNKLINGLKAKVKGYIPKHVG